MTLLDCDNMFPNRMTDVAKACGRIIRQKTLQWAARRPRLALTLVIMLATMIMPVVSVLMLTPIALIFTGAGILIDYGAVGVLYNIFFKGFALATLFVALFLVFLAFITFVSVLHSHRSYFAKYINLKKVLNSDSTSLLLQED